MMAGRAGGTPGLGRRGTIVLVLLILSPACATVRLPLCPQVAALSYPTPPPQGTMVGRFTKEQAAERNIRISVLSSFIAAFSGRRGQVTWLKKHYADLLCGFDTDRVTLDAQTYLVCRTHAPGWIKLAQSRQPERLMLAETKFETVCAR